MTSEQLRDPDVGSYWVQREPPHRDVDAIEQLLDISDRVRADEDLRNSEARFRSAVDNSP